MTFSHDVEFALAIVVDLVNTDPTVAGVELLPDVDALKSFVVDHEISGVDTLTRSDLLAVRDLRGRLRPAFLAGDTDEAAAIVNSVLSDAQSRPRLASHDGYDWHIHYFAPGSPIAEHLHIDAGMSLAMVVSAGEYERLQVCDAPDCDRVLVDLSRNRSKRYCDSRTCGNRLHVAAYRERRRAASA